MTADVKEWKPASFAASRLSRLDNYPGRNATPLWEVCEGFCLSTAAEDVVESSGENERDATPARGAIGGTLPSHLRPAWEDWTNESCQTSATSRGRSGHTGGFGYSHRRRQPHGKNLRNPHKGRGHPRDGPPPDQKGRERLRDVELRPGIQ